METYDPNKIGSRIAWGRSHSVYRYGENEVIKFPRWQSVFGTLLFDRVVHDELICRNYFGDYCLDTRVVQAPDGTHRAEIQPFVAGGHYLSKSDLADPVIKQHFDAFTDRYKEFIDTGHSPLDLIGQGGVLWRCLSNVFVLENKDLKIFDITIMDTKGLGGWGILFGPVFLYARIRQRNTLRWLKS
ncbi:hypothetical protein HY969_04230 [Candidatus Kaiserbacteria bacterium]|nr:hypothetical protein [Candidatus Kaiserbacteria bacterium]